MRSGGAEGDLVGLGALQEEMRRVLPGHADAAVQLYALLRGLHGDLGAVRLRDRRGEPVVRVPFGGGRRGVAGSRARLLDEGVFVTGFGYPVVPEGTARVRVQMSAALSPEHLEQAIEAFRRVRPGGAGVSAS